MAPITAAQTGWATAFPAHVTAVDAEAICPDSLVPPLLLRCCASEPLPAPPPKALDSHDQRGGWASSWRVRCRRWNLSSGCASLRPWREPSAPLGRRLHAACGIEVQFHRERPALRPASVLYIRSTTRCSPHRRRSRSRPTSVARTIDASRRDGHESPAQGPSLPEPR